MRDSLELRDLASVQGELEDILGELKDREKLTCWCMELEDYYRYLTQFGHAQTDVVINRTNSFLNREQTRKHINEFVRLDAGYNYMFFGFTEKPGYIETLSKAMFYEKFENVCGEQPKEITVGSKKVIVDPEKISAVIGAVTFSPSSHDLKFVLEQVEKAKQEAMTKEGKFCIYNL